MTRREKKIGRGEKEEKGKEEEGRRASIEHGGNGERRYGEGEI
jgi:hypothetical protein